ncbi:MAG: hypothetical protein QOF15_2486 [Mycobacterium sp.]|nr:hypothetical protein [Mycobacterium sp.]
MPVLPILLPKNIGHFERVNDVSGPPQDLAGMRTLVIGASSGIGQAFAVAAHARGARLALAARRIELLTKAAETLDGTAHELDVSNTSSIKPVIEEIAAALGGFDAVIFTSAVAPFAHVEDTDVTTWMHAFVVNAVAASQILQAALPHLSENAVILIASCHDVGRPRAGVAAYNSSKAALDEILHSWREEHPELSIIRASIGPTKDTEILRGADRDLLAELYRAWVQNGQIPQQMSALSDVANTLVSLVDAARSNPTVVTDVVHLAPRHAAPARANRV